MNTPRINRFLGEWLDRQTSPDFFKKGLILLNAYDFLDSKADAIPGLIAHQKSLPGNERGRGNSVSDRYDLGYRL